MSVDRQTMEERIAAVMHARRMASTRPKPPAPPPAAALAAADKAREAAERKARLEAERLARETVRKAMEATLPPPEPEPAEAPAEPEEAREGAEGEAPWHLVWNNIRRPPVKEPGFYGGVLRCFRGMRNSTFRKALAEVVWWDLVEQRCNPAPERILREIKSYGFKPNEKPPMYTVEQERKLRAKMEELGWVFKTNKRKQPAEAQA